MYLERKRYTGSKRYFRFSA